MIRRIIKIDQEKCNGCGLCVTACHEGAIVLKEGKATLLRDDYCDGLGDCLPACPTEAISFEEREALPYDEAAVLANISQKGTSPAPCGCPGSNLKSLSPATAMAPAGQSFSALRQWPVQIKLVPANAPWLNNAHLLIAADCTAYACGDFHTRFMKDKITLIGCPKLDAGSYREKFLEILQNNNILSVTVVRMSVPCCSGIAQAAKEAVGNLDKNIPFSIVTINPEGQTLINL